MIEKLVTWLDGLPPLAGQLSGITILLLVAVIADYNAQLGETANVNLRRLTNFGTFRAYLKNYLVNHPRIRKDMTLMVRQLQPTETGVPIEIYCFTDTTEWAKYEGIQADIFDHILAQSREFGLNVFQSPSGQDFRQLKSAEL